MLQRIGPRACLAGSRLQVLTLSQSLQRTPPPQTTSTNPAFPAAQATTCFFLGGIEPPWFLRSAVVNSESQDSRGTAISTWRVPCPVSSPPICDDPLFAFPASHAEVGPSYPTVCHCHGLSVSRVEAIPIRRRCNASSLMVSTAVQSLSTQYGQAQLRDWTSWASQGPVCPSTLSGHRGRYPAPALLSNATLAGSVTAPLDRGAIHFAITHCSRLMDCCAQKENAGPRQRAFRHVVDRA